MDFLKTAGLNHNFKNLAMGRNTKKKTKKVGMEIL